MYQVFLTKQAAKDAKKHGKPLQSKLSQIFVSLADDPFPSQSEQLSGVFHFLYSYHFSYHGSSFRIADQVDFKAKTIIIIALGPRENFYKILKQKLG